MKNMLIDRDLKNQEMWCYDRAIPYFGLSTEQILTDIEDMKYIEDLKLAVDTAQKLMAINADCASPRLIAFVEVAIPIVAAFVRGSENFALWPTHLLTEKVDFAKKQIPQLQQQLAYVEANRHEPDSVLQKWLDRGIDKTKMQWLATYQSNVADISAVLQSRGIKVPA